MRAHFVRRFRSAGERQLLQRLIAARQVPVAMVTIPLIVLCATTAADSKEAAPLTRTDPARVQGLVDTLKHRLAIEAEVSVSIVDTNALLVSVECPKVENGAFTLSFEASFLDELDEDELSAVVAHELGHVWIYTHHPYLQTERLANQIAMRVVSRESLQRVYGKVWARAGTKGDLAGFLGEQE
jgi:hypothetical protein